MDEVASESKMRLQIKFNIDMLNNHWLAALKIPDVAAVQVLIKLKKTNVENYHIDEQVLGIT